MSEHTDGQKKRKRPTFAPSAGPSWRQHRSFGIQCQAKKIFPQRDYALWYAPSGCLQFSMVGQGSQGQMFIGIFCTNWSNIPRQIISFIFGFLSYDNYEKCVRWFSGYVQDSTLQHKTYSHTCNSRPIKTLNQFKQTENLELI